VPEAHKRVLGIVGSPRRGGNTETLIDEVLRGARDTGASVDKIILSELEIAPCQACEACRDTGECVQGDDLPELLRRMEDYPVWVLGTPVYWWGPSAQMKTFLDRWFCKSHRAEDKAMFQGRRVILAIPMGDADPATARHTVGMFTDALEYVNATLFAAILAPDANDPGDVRAKRDVMAAAYEAGKQAVSSGQ
jgi:multimeric flavodoxin WrbA